MLEIRNLCKLFGPPSEKILAAVQEGAEKDEILQKYGAHLGLRDISLSVTAGSLFVVMGLSGSGKSTLLRCLNRLIEPSAGEITIDGVDILALSQRQLQQFRRHKISMVFQGFGLLPHRTVLQNVAYGLELQGIPRHQREATACSWLATVGLTGYEKSYPQELSGGMQQRVGLARALAKDPDILLMDEPFSALDPLIRREMQAELIQLQKSLNKTIVFITHDLDEALRLGDRIAILKEGVLVQEGSGEDILLRPADDYVRAFIHTVNRGRFLKTAAAMIPCHAITLDQQDLASLLDQLRQQADDFAYLVDKDNRLLGVVTKKAAEQAIHQGIKTVDAALAIVSAVTPDTVLENILLHLLNSPWPLAVTGLKGELLGVVSRDKVLDILRKPVN
jgi:glycine betaine/proline transport system ATP-binding protein